MIVYKGGRHLPAILKALAEAGRIDDAVIGELLGLPGERVAPARDWPAQPASYLATVIVAPAGRSANQLVSGSDATPLDSNRALGQGGTT